MDFEILSLNQAEDYTDNNVGLDSTDISTPEYDHFCHKNIV